MNQIVADAIERADVLLVLVSPSFLASRVCMDLDVPSIMARSAAGRAHVVPILARDCGLAGTPFAGVQMRPLDGGAIASRADRDAAWREIAREVGSVAGAVHVRGVVGEHVPGAGGRGSHRRRRACAPAVEAPERCGPAYDVLHRLLDGRTPRAQWLLMTAAVFAPATVPLEWVMPAPEPAAEYLTARSALGELALLRLVVVDERAGTLSMRPSLRACVKDRVSPDAWNHLASWAVRMIERWLARAGSDLVEARLPHLREVLALAQEMEDEPAATELYDRFADHFRTRGAAPGTPAWYESEIAVAEKALGPEHPTVATIMAEVAEVAARAGAEEVARALMERTIALAEKLYGPDHWKVADRLTMLARLLEETGRPEQALPLMQRVVYINLRTRKSNHSHVADSLFTLAMLWQTVGQPHQALTPMQRAIDVLEQARSPNSPYLAFLRRKLAELRKDLAGPRTPPGAPLSA
jgi:Tetratricopeptide repeat